MQTNLFEQIEANGISIEQAAKIANVSTATIRNWIKTGYLTRLENGLITEDSINYFMSNVAGKDKLNSRANKLQKDEHNHEEATDNIKSLFQKYSGEKIGVEYENSLSNSFRNKEGIYYTPSWIVADMFKNIPINTNTKFLDPCCGSGNFIIQAIELGVLPENVYGFDVDENAVFITKQRIKDKFGFETPNIRVGDFLNEALRLNRENTLFDLIFTNPPWGKKIEKSEKEKFATLYNCGNSFDTTSLFMGASFSLLKQDGFLGFLIQEAFFNITTFEDIRSKIVSKQILRLVDYDKAFKGLLTKAQSIIIANCGSSDNTVIECYYNHTAYSRSLSSFKNNPKHIFNFWTNEEEAKVIDRLYSCNHTTLQDKARWALGIVTGNNVKYCYEIKVNDNYIPIYKGSDITKNGLKEASNFILNDFSNFQQVAPIEMYQAAEKLIYKFISSNLCFFYDNQQRFVLNSANIVIPKNIGITMQQLTDILNSEIINWLFNKLFSTHKVLRGDLELLPIHTEYFKKYEKFSEETYLEYLQLTKTENGTFRIKN
ncbi:N-6 DNA methylase [Bacteroidales bacterium OttesenSCG-928-I21]|nr:N-6 DNA methylase [Bacteroidales bacterium OttesenSCG-928-I21]